MSEQPLEKRAHAVCFDLVGIEPTEHLHLSLDAQEIIRELLAAKDAAAQEAASLRADLARETELRRKADRHVASLQLALNEKPFPSDVAVLEDAISSLRAQLATLEQEYPPQHKGDCGAWLILSRFEKMIDPGRECTCGLADLISQLHREP